MKQLLFLITGFIFRLTIIAQGNSGDKGNGNDKPKNEKSSTQDNNDQKEKAGKEIFCRTH